MRCVIDRTVGLLPLSEYSLKLRRCPQAVRLYRVEREYARRLAAQMATLPAADVITIIPTYQRPAALRRAVTSALGQTYRDHHVVVVDDGGGDPLDLPDDDRLTILRLPANVGVAGIVRNVGIRLSRSRLIAFLDDDNLWEAEHLAVAVAHHVGDTAITYSALRRVEADGSPIDVLGAPFRRRTMRAEAVTDTNVLVARRDRAVRFSRVVRRREDFPGEDWELLWRLSRRRAVLHIPIVTATYVRHSGSYYSSWGDGVTGD